jgi:transcription initiation factor TFIIB
MTKIETETPLYHEDKMPTNCCSICGNTNIVFDPQTREGICGKCGLVIEDIELDRGQDFRAFTLDQRENRPRTGAPTTLTIHDQGISTNMGRIDRDSRGRRIDQKKQFQFRRLRNWHRRTKVKESSQRNLANALSFLDKVSDQSKLNLPKNTQEEASRIYRKVLEMELIRGRSIDLVMAASIYTACRITKKVKSLEEVAKATNLSKKSLAKTYRFLVRKTGINVDRDRSIRHLPKYISKLKLSGVTERYALKILETCEEAKISAGKDPGGLAASALYISCVTMGEKRTQQKIAGVAEVTEVTIRNRYKEMVDKLNFEIYL